MTVSTIDGTLESVSVKRKASKLWRMENLSFRKADGSEEPFPGIMVVTPEVGAQLQPGAAGRFYLYKSIDHRGLHAVRLADSTVLMKFPATNENLMAVLFVINLAVLIGLMVVEGRPYLLTIALVPFTGVLYFLYRRTRVQAEAQVAADNP